MKDTRLIGTTGASLILIALCMTLLCTMCGCATTNDGRTGLRGEICAFGYCVTPQAMTASAVTVNETAVVAGPRVAPATIVSQPVVAETERTVVQQVQVPAPPVAYAPQPAPMTYLPQREK